MLVPGRWHIKRSTKHFARFATGASVTVMHRGANARSTFVGMKYGGLEHSISFVA